MDLFLAVFTAGFCREYRLPEPEEEECRLPLGRYFPDLGSRSCLVLLPKGDVWHLKIPRSQTAKLYEGGPEESQDIRNKGRNPEECGGKDSERKGAGPKEEKTRAL